MEPQHGFTHSVLITELIGGFSLQVIFWRIEKLED
jgi:hypothetical protein